MPRRRLPSPSMVVAIVALCLAMTGGAVAAVSGIGSQQIRNGSIQLKDLSPSIREAIAEAGSKVTYGDLSAGAKNQLGTQASDAAREAVQKTQPTTLAEAKRAAEQAAGPIAAQVAAQAAAAAVAGKTGPQGETGQKGDPGTPGVTATYTTSASGVGLTATSDLATLTLPAGTWVLFAHLNAVNNVGSAQRLDCYFTGTPDENDLAKVRAEALDSTSAIYGDLSLQVVTTLGGPTAVKVTCSPTGTTPNWTFNSVKLTAVQTASVARQ